MTTRLPTPDVVVTAETAPYWRAAAGGQLLLPRCIRCHRAIWYPRAFCPFCGATEVAWEPASGRGRIYSVTVVRRAPHPHYADSVPYSLALIDLDEAVRVLSNVVTDDLDALAIGQVVEAIFVPISDDRAIVRFRLAR